MAELQRWIQRIFDFSLPVDLFPALLERVSGTPARLEEKVRGVPDELLAQGIDGGWSLKVHAGHLAILDVLHISRLDDFLSDGDTLRPADMSNAATNAADYNSMNIGEILGEFRKRRQTFVERVSQFSDEQLEIAKLHPRLSVKMRVIDNVAFCAEHDDHHLALMTEIRRKLGA